MTATHRNNTMPKIRPECEYATISTMNIYRGMPSNAPSFTNTSLKGILIFRRDASRTLPMALFHATARAMTSPATAATRIAEETSVAMVSILH